MKEGTNGKGRKVEGKKTNEEASEKSNKSVKSKEKRDEKGKMKIK